MPDYSLEFLRPDNSMQDTSWLTRHDEGELAVDVYENEKAIFVKTAIAGVKPEDLELSLSHDMLTIRGKRHEDVNGEEDYRWLSRECHWGAFSRSIILPSDVRFDKAEAIFKNGILMIKLPKSSKTNSIKLRVEDD